MAKKSTKANFKPTVGKRTLNRPGKTAKAGGGAPQNQQDPKRRLGRYETAGEHAMIGGRRGIIGQTTKQFRTDRKQPKK